MPVKFSTGKPSQRPDIVTTPTTPGVPPTQCTLVTRWGEWINRDKPETGSGDREVNHLFALPIIIVDIIIDKKKLMQKLMTCLSWNSIF